MSKLFVADIDFPNNYNEIYIVCFPRRTGGNFLINCLGLSDDCVFSHRILAEKQIDGDFNLNQKISYLTEKLQEARTTNKWKDLNLGNHQLFGLGIDPWNRGFPEMLKYDINQIIPILIKKNKKFFHILHNISHLDNVKLIWPNAKIFLFVNYRDFTDYQTDTYLHQYNNLCGYWNSFQDINLPPMPTDIDGFKNLELSTHPDISNEICRILNRDEEYDALWHKAVNCEVEKYFPNTAIWDVDASYANEDNLIENLKSLANSLNFHLVDEAYIRSYFNEWKYTLEHIRNYKRMQIE